MALDKGDHKTLALWAADCAGHVLPTFETQYPDDKQPREAIEAGRAWARGKAPVSEARTAAFAAHAAARDADNPAARAADYAVKAVAYSACTTETDVAAAEERERQVLRLPAHLRSAVYLPTIPPLMARD